MAFHVPELSRLKYEDHPLLGSDSSHGNNGAFVLPSPEPGWLLFLICSDGLSDDAFGRLADWEHVSVSARNKGSYKPVTRTPTWKEMKFIKGLCWDAEDCVVQYHPPESDYINNHDNVLHMWRWKSGEFPMPPKIAV